METLPKTANVACSGSTAEGTVSTSLLTFTPADWSTPQTVTITGADDYLIDGDIAYTVVLAAATSADANYDGPLDEWTNVAFFRNHYGTDTEPDAGIDFSRVVHGDQRFTYSRPIVAGDELTATLRVTSIKSLGGNSMVTSESSMVDVRGEHVVTSVSTLVIRGEDA